MCPSTLYCHPMEALFYLCLMIQFCSTFTVFWMKLALGACFGSFILHFNCVPDIFPEWCHSCKSYWRHLRSCSIHLGIDVMPTLSGLSETMRTVWPCWSNGTCWNYLICNLDYVSWWWMFWVSEKIAVWLSYFTWMVFWFWKAVDTYVVRF